jgi:hypothetical protein
MDMKKWSQIYLSLCLKWPHELNQIKFYNSINAPWHKKYTHTSGYIQVSAKYYVVRVFSILYLLNSNFEQYQKLLNTTKHSWIKLMSAK